MEVKTIKEDTFYVISMEEHGERKYLSLGWSRTDDITNARRYSKPEVAEERKEEEKRYFLEYGWNESIVNTMRVDCVSHKETYTITEV